MITLKELFSIIETLFLNHPEINSVTKFDVKDYIGARDKVYMNANIRYVNGQVQGKYINHNFMVTLADRLTHTGDNELEILSATQLIAEDVFTQLAASFDYTFQKNVNLVTFTEADGDRIAGIYFQINIQVLRSQNLCIVPDTVVPTFPMNFPIPFL
jgi:hypothetical protein